VRLSQDRGRTPSGIVRRPRHFLIYRLESDVVVIGRVLYDGMELSRHLNPDMFWD